MNNETKEEEEEVVEKRGRERERERGVGLIPAIQSTTTQTGCVSQAWLI